MLTGAGVKISVDAECENVQRHKCLINNLKLVSLFLPYSLLYIYKKVAYLLLYFCFCFFFLHESVDVQKSWHQTSQNFVNKSAHSFKYNQLLCPKDVLVTNYDDGFKGICRIKQCMYSLEQSHGAVEKKRTKLCCLHVFCREFYGMLEEYKHEDEHVILVYMNQACRVLL